MTIAASPLPEWQRGIPLARLKAFAQPFALKHKPLVFGAFGLTKERDIAVALDENRLCWVGPEESPHAVAIVRALNRDTEHADFSGRPIKLDAPCFVVGAFAALDVAAGRRLLSGMSVNIITKATLAQSPAPGFIVEIFEEDRVAREALAAFDATNYLGTKIMAGSEVKGLYGNGGDYPRAYETPPEQAATLTLLDAGFVGALRLEGMRNELARAAKWAQHYSSYNKRKSWTAFALRGYSDDPMFIEKPAEMSRDWKIEHPEEMKARPRWTPLAEKFKATMGVLEQLVADVGPLEFDRVRFMCLRKSDGELSRHADITDRDAGVADGKVVRLHIPVITNPDVAFHGWDARGLHIQRRFEAGDLFYLDQRKPHAVTNAGAVDRAHLVIDAVANERLRELIANRHVVEKSGEI